MILFTGCRRQESGSGWNLSPLRYGLRERGCGCRSWSGIGPRPVVESLCGSVDFLRRRLGVLVIRVFIDSVSKQCPNPRLNVALGNQHDDRFSVLGFTHIRSFECIRKLYSTVLCRFHVGINNDDQERGCSSAERGAASLDLLWILVADVLFAAATRTLSWQGRQPQA